MEDAHSNKNPLGDLFSSIKRYADLRIDELKLLFAENSAKIFSKIIYFFLMFILIGIVLGLFATILSFWFGIILHNKVGGMFLTAGIFILIMLILYLFRNKFLINKNLRMFLKMFFNDNKENGKK